MACKGIIGEITVKGDQDVEWKINSIFSYKVKGDSFRSPIFTLLNVEWYLVIFPAGDGEETEWITLYLHMHEKSVQKGATFSFGLKKSDGKVEEKISSRNWIFSNSEGIGTPKFLKRSKLLELKTELAPSDTLTVTCNLLGHDDLDSIAGTCKLFSDFLDMFITKKEYDVTLKVKDELFPVHKFILVARSPKLASRLKTTMKNETIDIQDYDPKVFNDFLLFLYSGTLEKLSPHMFELYTIAREFEVQDLKSACVIAMMAHLSEENLCDTLIFADKYREDTLKIKANHIFKENYGTFVRSDKWMTFMQEQPKLANELIIGMADYLKK